MTGLTEVALLKPLSLPLNSTLTPFLILMILATVEDLSHMGLHP